MREVVKAHWVDRADSNGGAEYLVMFPLGGKVPCATLAEARNVRGYWGRIYARDYAVRPHEVVRCAAAVYCPHAPKRTSCDRCKDSRARKVQMIAYELYKTEVDDGTYD